MVWFRVDDSLSDHEKVLDLQSRRGWQGALALWTLAGSWCGKHLTDGHVPAAVVTRLQCTKRDAALLVEVGLWDETDLGYVFHSWFSRNPSKAAVEAERAATRERVARHRGGNGSSNAVTNGVSNANVLDPTRPDPSRPVPTKPNKLGQVPGQLSEPPGPAPEVVLGPPPKPLTRANSAVVEPATGTVEARTWQAYAVEYRTRYGVSPVRNAKSNTIIKRLCERVPHEEAPAIAAGFVRSSKRYYVERMHQVELLLADAEAICTAVRTGRFVTSHGAAQADKQAGRADAYADLIDRLERKEAENATV